VELTDAIGQLRDWILTLSEASWHSIDCTVVGVRLVMHLELKDMTNPASALSPLPSFILRDAL
jgi:hypothetical protein